MRTIAALTAAILLSTPALAQTLPFPVVNERIDRDDFDTDGEYHAARSRQMQRDFLLREQQWNQEQQLEVEREQLKELRKLNKAREEARMQAQQEALFSRVEDLLRAP